MTPLDEQGMRERHTPTKDRGTHFAVCVLDDKVWPCDAIQALDALVAARGQKKALWVETDRRLRKGADRENALTVKLAEAERERDYWKAAESAREEERRQQTAALEADLAAMRGALERLVAVFAYQVPTAREMVARVWRKPKPPSPPTTRRRGGEKGGRKCAAYPRR